METALTIENLSKEYPGFQLNHVSFQIPEGSIMGFVGENGAGKSTTIKLILNMIERNSGRITIFGKDNIDAEREVKDQIGVVFSELHMPESFHGKKVNRIMKGIYSKWDENEFFRCLERFGLRREMKLKSYSRGMRMKLAIAIAISHQARFLIMDEPTSGLDPIVRDEILDIFLDFIQDEGHSILVSSHIVGDLEKIADYITFIHRGNIVLSEEKDLLLEKYRILRGPKELFGQFEPGTLIGYRENRFGAEAMIEAADLSRYKAGLADMVLDPAGIEDIMLYHVKGERV